MERRDALRHNTNDLNFSPIIDQFIRGFSWVILVMLVILFFKSASFKGYLGERLVRFAAWLRLDRRIYRRVHNVTLATPDGTTQIDHVLVSRYGIFVVETKNLKGWIFGSETQPQWTQKIFKKSFKFQNPLRQNFRHVKALEATLQVPLETIHSVVAFVGECEIKTPMPSNVTSGSGFIRYIKSFKSPVFTDEHVDTLVHRLNRKRLEPSFATSRAHVADIQQRVATKASRQCPACSSPLVERTAKKGVNAGKKFLGCSAYPKCRTIVQA